MTLVICRELRKVAGGYILELRWPYGPDPGSWGEVICTSWDEVLKKLTEARGEVP